MRAAALLLIAAVEVGGVFGGASVSGRQVDAHTLEIDIQVEAPPGASVVAHLIEPGGVSQVVALVERESGVYGAIIELRRVNFVVVFEAIGTEQSDGLTLLELGLDPALLGIAPGVATTTTGPDGRDPAVSQWGWLGLAAGAGALSLLAFWALGERSPSETEEHIEPEDR